MANESLRNADVKFTYKDLLSAPDDGNRYEIFQGEVIMTPSPSREHQRIIFNLCNIFGRHLRQTRSGEVYPSPFDVCFNEDTVLQPDLFFISKERLGKESGFALMDMFRANDEIRSLYFVDLKFTAGQVFE